MAFSRKHYVAIGDVIGTAGISPRARDLITEDLIEIFKASFTYHFIW